MLPNVLASLRPLSANLWWSWDDRAPDVWQHIDPELWEAVHHNPVALLDATPQSRWHDLAQEPEFCALVADVAQRFQTYQQRSRWCAEAAPALNAPVAYFSMEFGVHESVRIYSGGLGVLAGDHLRSASDLGVPMVGVGLLYREGYFQQMVYDGRQAAAFALQRYDRLPLTRCTDADGVPLVVEIPREWRTIKALVWRMDIGNVPLFLLDTDHEDNHERDRELTYHLYGGDTRTRIGQEILLGLGGVRALRALGYEPSLYHLNEGHCAFLLLELLREQLALGLSLRQALHAVRTQTVFTTHTPVPAGHDRFYWDDLSAELGPWRDTLGLPEGTFMDLGRVHPGDVDEPLCMTVLALRGSELANGVSALHGEVSREMWHSMWPRRAVEDVPIGHITNGVHPLFWMAQPTRALLDTHIPGWRDAPWEPTQWDALDRIPSADLWALRTQLRHALLDLVHARTGKRLDPHALTIGFARRFATYKRGDLIFRDPERLRALLDGDFPVQLLFAGKAHPKDRPGQDVLAQVIRFSQDPRYRHRIAFIEDYDMVIGRAMTSGADVWLNNPRRPREASGTSGQKVGLNGGLNLSTIDGWWAEAAESGHGWSIGQSEVWEDTAAGDAFDAESLYTALEQDVLPAWSTRDASGLPQDWLTRVRNAIRDCGSRFTSHRMVHDYVLELYAPVVQARQNASDTQT